jgi:hypothetical protein
VGYTGGTAVAQKWTAFGGWAATPAVALPPGSGVNYILNSISCMSTTFCMAVGTYHATGGTVGDRPMTQVWNGSTWTYQGNMPWASGVGGAGYGVSCVSTTVCYGVGETTTTMPLAAIWNGVHWTSQLTPLAPGATNAVLRGVSCVAAGRCEASGWSLFGGTPTGLIETYS